MLVVLALGAVPVHAAEGPWTEPFALEPSTLLELASQVQEGEDPSASITLLWKQRRVRIDEEGRLEYRDWTVSLLRDAAAIQRMGKIDAEWHPWSGQRPVLRARVIHAGGSVSELDPASIMESAAESEHPDLLQADRKVVAALPALQPGCVVETLVEVPEYRSEFSGGRAVLYGLMELYWLREGEYRIEVPASVQLHLSENLEGLDAEIQDRDEGDRHIRSYRFRAMAPVEYPEFDLETWPQDFPSVGFGTGDDWAATARAYFSVLEPILDSYEPDEALREELDEARNSENPVQAALDIVQERVRYTQLDLGKSPIAPASLQEICDRGFGDCKDQATLLVALLEELGHPARVVLTSTEGPREGIEQIPGIGLFNHAIVMVPGAEAVWIDPTVPYYPAGNLPAYLQDRPALVVAEDTQDITRTPRTRSTANWWRELRSIDLPFEGVARAHEHTETVGPVGYDFRTALRDNTGTERREWLQSYAEDVYLAGSEIEIQVHETDALEQPVVVELEIPQAECGYSDWGSTQVLLDLSAMWNFLPDAIWEYTDDEVQPLPLEELPQSIRLGEPLSASIRYEIALPPDLRCVADLRDQLAEQYPLRMGLRYETTAPDTLVVVAFFEQSAEEIPREDFSRFVEQLVRLELPTEALDFLYEGDFLVEEGRLGEALELANAEIAAFPGELMPRVRHIEALLDSGLAWAAREECREVLDENPDSELLWRLEGMILLKDSDGRPLCGDWDREGVLKAFRRAAELDPENPGAAWGIAETSLFGDDGFFFGEGTDAKELEEDLLRAHELLPRVDWEPSLASVLLLNEHPQELRGILDSFQNEVTRDAAEFLLREHEGGVEHALNASERLSPNAYRGLVLQTAASEYFKFGRYEESGRLFEVADELGFLGDHSEQIRAMLRWLDPASCGEYAEDPVVAPAHAYLRAALIDEDLDAMGDRAGRYLREYADRIHEALGRDRLPFVAGALGNGRGDYSRPVIEGLCNCGFRFVSEGSDEYGYRISITSFTTGDQSAPFGYVVKEDGEYRLLSLIQWPGPVGRQILELVEDGNAKAALRWITWARANGWKPATLGGILDDHLDELLRVPYNHTELDLQLAGAVLVASVDPKRALKVAKRALDRDRESDTFDPAHQALLALALRQSEDYERLRKHLEPIWGEGGQTLDLPLGYLLFECYRRLDDLDRAQRQLDRLGELGLQESWVAVDQANLALQRGEYATAIELYEPLAEWPFCANQLLWARLEGDLLGSKDLAIARRLAVGDNVSELHTAACALARLGEATEARDTMHRYLYRGDATMMVPDHWLARGLLAESVGEMVWARRAYEASIEAEDEVEPMSSAQVAAKRLQTLAADE